MQFLHIILKSAQQTDADDIKRKPLGNRLIHKLIG